MSGRPQLHYLKSITLGKGPEKATVDLESYWLADYDNVAQAGVELPSIISWLNYHYAEAAELAERFERVYKETEAEVYFALRGGDFQQLYGENGKQTEKALDRAALLDPRVQEAAAASENATKVAQKIKGQISAMQCKLDLIRTSEATRRRIHEPMPTREEIPDEAVDVPHRNRKTPETENTEERES